MTIENKIRFCRAMATKVNDLWDEVYGPSMMKNWIAYAIRLNIEAQGALSADIERWARTWGIAVHLRLVMARLLFDNRQP